MKLAITLAKSSKICYLIILETSNIQFTQYMFLLVSHLPFMKLIISLALKQHSLTVRNASPPQCWFNSNKNLSFKAKKKTLELQEIDLFQLTFKINICHIHQALLLNNQVLASKDPTKRLSNIASNERSENRTTKIVLMKVLLRESK